MATSALISSGGFQTGAPLYLEVRRLIADAIRSGEWRPGEALPPEKKLGERFGVSTGTLRRAVDELAAAGLLVRRQGLGTFVVRHSQDRYLFSFFHVVGQDGRKEYPEVRFVRFGVARADAFASEALGVRRDSRLLHLTNQLSLSGEVALLDEIFLPEALFPGLTETRLRQRTTTLYQMYQDEFDVTVVRTAERVRAAATSRGQARLLNVEAGRPLLQIIRVAYSFHDRPVELRYSYVNTNRCEYRPEPFLRKNA